MSQELTPEDKELIKKIEEDAYGLQLRYRGCSQTCLKALQDNLGLGDKESLKAANSLCTGISGMGTGTCGAMLGGNMAIALAFGREDMEEPGGPREGLAPDKIRGSNFNRAYVLGRELYDKFREKAWGLTACRDLQEHIFGYFSDSADPKYLKMKETGEYYSALSKEACKLVALGAGLAAEIILREKRLDEEREKHTS